LNFEIRDFPNGGKHVADCRMSGYHPTAINIQETCGVNIAKGSTVGQHVIDGRSNGFSRDLMVSLRHER